MSLWGLLGIPAPTVPSPLVLPTLPVPPIVGVYAQALLDSVPVGLYRMADAPQAPTASVSVMANLAVPELPGQFLTTALAAPRLLLADPGAGAVGALSDVVTQAVAQTLDGDVLDLVGDFTIEASVRPGFAVPGEFGTLLLARGTPGGVDASLGLYLLSEPSLLDRLIAVASPGGVWQAVTDYTPPLSPEVEVHVALTYEAATLTSTILLNAEPVAQAVHAAGVLPTTATSTVVSTRPTGAIADVVQFPRVLPAAEIRRHVEAFREERPDTRPRTRSTYFRLPHKYQEADAAPPANFALLRYLSLVGDAAAELEDLVDRIDYRRPEEGGLAGDTSDLVDPATAPAEWLEWLAQLAGVRIADLATEADRRATIGAAAGGHFGGTIPAMTAAAQTVLTGSRSVIFRRHHLGNPWVMEVRTRATETPLGGTSVIAAIYNARAKPAGVSLVHANAESSWDVLEAGRPTFEEYGEASGGVSWTAIEETQAALTYDPRAIAGLILWMAPEQVPGANGATVLFADDLSGNGNTLSVPTATKPTILTAGIGGRQCLRFPAAGDVTMGRAAIAGGDVAQGNTVFIVVRFAAFGSTRSLLAPFPGTTGHAAYAGSAGALTMAAPTAAATGRTLVAGNAYVITMEFNGAASTVQFSRGPIATGLNVGGDPLIGFQLGLAGFPMNADVGEVLIYDRILAAADRLRLIDGLMARFGVS